MRFNQNNKLIFIAVLIFFLTGMLFSWPTAAQTQRAKASSSAAPSSVKPIPRLVDLGAKKCIPCIMMAPILEELKKEYKGVVQVDFIDVWENQNAGREYSIRAIPTQIFYNASGKELYRHMGFMSRESILAKFQDLGMLPGKDSKKGK